MRGAAAGPNVGFPLPGDVPAGQSAVTCLPSINGGSEQVSAGIYAMPGLRNAGHLPGANLEHEWPANLGSFGKNAHVHSGLSDTSIVNGGGTASPCRIRCRLNSNWSRSSRNRFA